MTDSIINFKLFFPLLTANKSFDESFDLFYDEIGRIYKASCPIKTKEIGTENAKKPWIKGWVLLKIKRKHYLYKRYKQGAITYNDYKIFESQVSKIIKKAKYDFYIGKYNQCAGDTKETWKLTNSVLGISKSRAPSDIQVSTEGGLVDDQYEVSNLFNDYFIQVGANLAREITNLQIDPLSYMGDRNPNNFFFQPTNASEIQAIISTFKNKKTNNNNIPTSVLKRVSHSLSELLAEIFNESIICGKFPEILKTGRVIPLFKSGSRSSLSNYRPITTVSIFSKIFEKLVHKRLINFIEKFNIINLNQFGFQKNKNTSDALLEFTDNIYDALNNKQHFLSIFLDFSRAFDTVRIDILLDKFEFLGFRGPIYSWIKSFLCERKQFVNIGEKISDIQLTKMGVPQGSTLGPLFFIIYINDMKNSLSNMKVIHFADDSTLYASFEKKLDISELINTNLLSLRNWLSANKLFLNINKTNYIIFNNRSRPPDLNLKIGDRIIKRTDIHKFLGIKIDENLIFRAHVENLSSQVARNVGMIRKMSQHVPKSVLRQLHHAFVFSKFTYALPVYGSACPTYVRRLSKLVEKSIKTVVGARTFVSDICKRENIFDFQLAHKFFSNIKMYQILHSNQHVYFKNKIQSFQVYHMYGTRNLHSNCLTLPFYHFSKCQRSFLYNGIENWNNLPLSLRNSNESKFKRNLKKFLLS